MNVDGYGMRIHTFDSAPARPRAGALRVVVGVDFGDPSLAAARWVAGRLAPDAEIVLVHVIPVPSGPPFLLKHLRAPGPLFDQVTPPLWGGLRGLAGVLGASRTRVELRAGDPAEELAAAVAASGADLVCVGRPRERAETAGYGRNTVNRLLRRIEVPLLQPAGPLLAAPARVLAAIDGGDSSDAVAAAAWSIAARAEARLTALHVLDDVVRHYARTARVAGESFPGAADSSAGAAESSAGETSSTEEDEALRRATADWLRATLERAGARDERCDVLVGEGDPGGDILATARRLAAELIVVGRAGMDAAGSNEVGSTTRLLLRVAPCPILVVPPARVRGPAPGPGRERTLRLPRRVGASWAPRVGSWGDPPPAARGDVA